MPTAAALSAGGAERAVNQHFGPGGQMRGERQHDRRRMRLRRGLERLRADQHADVEQDRRDRHDGDHIEQQRDDAEARQHDHHHAGRRRIADAAAHRLPAGMADIDGVDERVAHQRADAAEHAVGGQHARRWISVAGGFGAFHVVHGLDQIIDAEGNGGDQNGADELEAAEGVPARRHAAAKCGCCAARSTARRRSCRHSAARKCSSPRR